MLPGTQESKAPTPLLRQSGITKLKKTKGKQKVFKGAAEYKAGPEYKLRFVFGAKNCLCRDLSRAAGGLVSQRFDKRFQAFQALSLRLVLRESHCSTTHSRPAGTRIYIILILESPQRRTRLWLNKAAAKQNFSPELLPSHGQEPQPSPPHHTARLHCVSRRTYRSQIGLKL